MVFILRSIGDSLWGGLVWGEPEFVLTGFARCVWHGGTITGRGRVFTRISSDVYLAAVDGEMSEIASGVYASNWD